MRPLKDEPGCYECAADIAKQRDVLKRSLRFWLRHNRTPIEMGFGGKPSRYCIVVRESAVLDAITGKEPTRRKR